jgi:choline dehydrogenase-like flavoprotein
VAGEEISRRSSCNCVIVGSGAGGALARNAAQRVLLLEAGGDHENYDYQVPAIRGRSARRVD